MDRPYIYWVQDSSGVNTCHINESGLTFQQSLIGRLVYQGEGNWRVILKDDTDITPEDGCLSLSGARKCLEAHSAKQVKKTNKPDRVTPRVAQSGRI